MRYDTPVYFRSVSERKYNYDTGDYEGGEIIEDMEYAAVENTRNETVHFVYGELREDAVTIHLQNQYKKPFSSLRIEDKIYKVGYIRRLRTKMAIIATEEVTGNG